MKRPRWGTGILPLLTTSIFLGYDAGKVKALLKTHNCGWLAGCFPLECFISLPKVELATDILEKAVRQYEL